MRVLVLISILILLTGCEYLSNAVENVKNKGTLQGVISCVKENSEIDDFLDRKIVREACFEVHSKSSNKDFTSDNCSARVKLSDFAYVTFNGKCSNKSENLITSIKTIIYLENFPGKKVNDEVVKSTKSIYGTKSNLELLPNDTFYFSTTATLEDDISEYIKNNQMPYCSALDENKDMPCLSWSFSSYEYVQLKID